MFAVLIIIVLLISIHNQVLFKNMVLDTYIQAMINSGMDSVSVQYLVIMKLKVAIHNYAIFTWYDMVSMKVPVKIVSN